MIRVSSDSHLLGSRLEAGAVVCVRDKRKAKRFATGTVTSSNKLDRVRKKVVGLDKARDSPPEPALRSVL